MKYRAGLRAAAALALALNLFRPAMGQTVPSPVQPLQLACSESQVSPVVLARLQQHWQPHGPVLRQQAQLRSGLSLRCETDAALGSDAFTLHSSPAGFVLRASSLRGWHYGVYAALTQLGYAFWHPFEPVTPPVLPPLQAHTEHFAPALKQRGFSHHTMHPLELSHVLNGWGPAGPEDLAGWEALLPEYEAWLEWLVAQRQNKLEWVLLEKASWADFSRSPERQRRLRELVRRAQAFGLQIGIDAPLALEQQNGWRLIRQPGSAAEDQAQLLKSLDWLAACGFDFITTEMGLSEFHHGGAARMLDWLNTAAEHLDTRHGLPFMTKVHISSGQQTPDFRDPETGEPLNINFLPYYADPRVGTMPHTVQIYSLDDPAPTYGWQNFSEMLRFMRFSQRDQPARQMVWYPETSYWINYDINLPLFLPVYAQRRQHDLQLIQAQGVALDGQIVFSSGFEWGYWLNDLLSARGTWQSPAEPGNRDDLAEMLHQTLAPFGPARPALHQLLQDSMQIQHQRLILGELNGQRPEPVERQNAMAYLAGQDTWSDLAALIRRFGLPGFQTQPERDSFAQLRSDPLIAERFRQHTLPLLVATERDFAALSRRGAALEDQIPLHVKTYWAEIRDGLAINAARARFVRSLAEASLQQQVRQQAQARRWLDQAAVALSEAQNITARRSQAYRADLTRLAERNPNPTAYSYGYLWQAHSLFFWQRDWQQVAARNQHPCLMNSIDPLEVALPDPGGDWRAGLARSLGPLLGLKDCFDPPLPAN